MKERMSRVSRATIVHVLDCSCQALGSDRAVRAPIFSPLLFHRGWRSLTTERSQMMEAEKLGQGRGLEARVTLKKAWSQ